jgi:hypothetical protein
MKLGFNSNVEAGGAVYHVQTEDRGLHHPFVDTVILSAGRVVHRRSASYEDLLSGKELNQTALRELVERQHREVVEGLRSGVLVFEEPGPPALALKLCNPTSWLCEGQASLEIEVLSRPENRPVPGVEVVVSIDHADGGEALRLSSQTGSDGRAQVKFPMPDLASDPSPALVIGLAGAGNESKLRYRLKPGARPAAPSRTL